MAEGVYSLRDCQARILDGTANTPLFVRIHFLDGTLTVPIRRPRSEEELVLNQGVADTLMHFRTVSDKPIYEPVPLSVDALVHSDRTLNDTLIALSNPYDAGTWQPGGTSTFVNASTLGNIDNAEGTAVAAASPVDSHEANFLTILEARLSGMTTVFVQRWTGLFWHKIDLGIGNPATLKMEARMYGIASKAAAFTVATEIT